MARALGDVWAFSELWHELGLVLLRARYTTPVEHSLRAMVFCPAAATVGELLAMGDQALVQLAGEQGDAVESRLVSEEMAGNAGNEDLAAAAGAEHDQIEPGPVLRPIAMLCPCARMVGFTLLLPAL